jgi:hypothetical protein
MHACIRNTLAHTPLASSEQQHTQRLASRLVQRQKQSGRPRSQDSQTARCSARWPSRCGPRKTLSLCRACRMRKKGVGRVLRVRAVDRDTRALQGDRANGRGCGMGHAPAIITSHSTSNSGSSRGFLKKRLTSPIMGSALISSFVSSTSLGIGSSGRARMTNVSSSNMKSKI